MFAESLRRQNATPEYIEEELSHTIHLVERELGVFVDEEYPLVKFWNQVDEIEWYREEEKKEQDKLKSKY